LLTAWPKLNTGPWSNQTKALAELRHKCGKDLANFECSKFEGFANSRASQMSISLRPPPARLQNIGDAFTSKRSLLEPRRDLHDFDHVARRILASEAHAGRSYGPLRTVPVSIDRAA
jgi:hypothetical protein